MAEEFVKGLSPAEQMYVKNGAAYYEKDDFEPDLLKSFGLGTIFFPAFYFWLVEYNGLPIENYPKELLAREIIDEDRAKGMEELFGHVKAGWKSKSKKGRDEASFRGWHYILGDTAVGLGIR